MYLENFYDMTKKERNKLLQPIAEDLGLYLNRDIAYKMIELNGFKIILGLLFDTCSNKNMFRPYYFGQCLFIPTNFLTLSFGDTITHPRENRTTDFWDIESYQMYKSLIYTKFLDFVGNTTSFKSFLNALVKRKYPYYSNESNKAEICAYINIILNNKKEALSWLKIVIDEPNPRNLTFVEERRGQTVKIFNLLKTDNYVSIFEIFCQWQNETINSLKLNL